MGWDHGEMIDNNRLWTKCNYCGNEMKGSGVSRLKQHIAGGFLNVEKCLKCLVAISRAMREHMDSKKRDNEEVMTQKAALRGTLMEPMRKKHGHVNNFVNDDESTDEIFPEERERLNISIQRSIQDVHENELGTGVIGPTPYEITGPILDAEIEEIQEVLRIMDGEKQATMGYVYEGVRRNKLAIEVALPRSHKKYCDIIDRRLKDQMIRDIHLADAMYGIADSTAIRGRTKTDPDDPRDALSDECYNDGQPVRPNTFLATWAERLSGLSKHGEGSNKGAQKLSNVVDVIDEESEKSGDLMKNTAVSKFVRLEDQVADTITKVLSEAQYCYL
ncbi:hypothetical protein BUALT_Bualt03G0192300 [Buddleja alternifolia]|uniref:BED-type domain-containing protein n=1 Tax=Buddleja alternifolia TaxID=168488 RepID=A0AAV6Y2B5_9LAMI|nr:hypothetical protein BUALT_Bualt03G0192300 [Buddleja alternifolia]